MLRKPKISILLPNLNTRRYLEERMHSIWNQTLEDWELIVVDGYSNDGSWEFLTECARKDSRIRLYQSGERGIYNNFNKCIQYANGKYVYFATSDDTFSLNALKEMSSALDGNPECDLAHCKLRIIDEEGNNINSQQSWDNYFIVSYFGDLINKKHVRKAPHDGVLHFSGITVYTSLTQLLIRRSLFNKVGLFIEDYGSIADYEWAMRATLIANTVHIPEYLATWRVHKKQATNQDSIKRAKASGMFIRMANHAIKTARKLNPAVISSFNIKELKYILEKERFYYKIIGKKNKLARYFTLFQWLFISNNIILEFYKSEKENKNFISQSEFLKYTKKMIEKHRLENNLVRISK